MSAESGKAHNIVQVIRSAVDRLPDSEAAQLDEASKTVAALVEALKWASEHLHRIYDSAEPGDDAMLDAIDVALKAAGVATFGGLEGSL